MFILPDEPPPPSSSHNESVPSYCKNDEGDIFLAAESWKPDVCTSCVCRDSVISCYSESCPSVSCERPVLRKGQCCPYCIGKTKKKNPLFLPVGIESTLTAICINRFVFVTCPTDPKEQYEAGERCKRCVPSSQPVRNEERLSQSAAMFQRSPLLLGSFAVSAFSVSNALSPPCHLQGLFVHIQTHTKVH